MNNGVSIKARLARVWRFVTDEVWDVELSALSVRRRFGVNAIRVVQLVIKDFRKDECPLHAAALTFSTMMSIVPVLALSLALARGLGGEDAAKGWIREGVADWTSGFSKGTNAVSGASGAQSSAAQVAVVVTPAVSNPLGAAAIDDVDPAALAKQINRIVESGFEKMENVSFRALGGVGLAVLVWMVIAVLGRVESSFNQVWGVTVERPLLRKFTDYLSVLFILPILLVAASSLPIVDFTTRYLDAHSARVVRDVLGSGLLKHLTVFTMTSLAFTFLIMWMPNARVRFLPGLAGGVITAVCFLIWLWVCAALQVGAARAGKIYGSFATLPILLAWVNVSWQIIFLGAESAFAIQNCSTYRMEQGAHRASVRARLILALSVVTDAARAMMTDGRPFSANAYAQERRIPVRFLLSTMDELIHAGLMAEVVAAPGSYVLLRTPDTIPVNDVFNCMMQAGVNPGGLGLGRVPVAVIGVVDLMDKGMDGALKGMTVRDVAGKI